MRKIIILALAAFMFTACANKNKGYVDRAVKNLEASLDYPKQLKIIATSKADSAFGNNYFTRDEMRGIVNLEYQYRNNFIDVYYWDTDGQKKIS